MMTVDDIDEKTAERAVRHMFKRAGFELVSLNGFRPTCTALLYVLGAWTRDLDADKPFNVYTVTPIFSRTSSYTKFHSKKHPAPMSFKHALKYMLEMMSREDSVCLRIEDLSRTRAVMTKKDSLCSLLVEADLAE